MNAIRIGIRFVNQTKWKIKIIAKNSLGKRDPVIQL